MLVYIDESGDAGLRVERGSSPVFVAAMVIFTDAENAAFTRRLIEGSAARRQHKGEFKFSKSRDIVRDQFFRAVAAAPFRLRAPIDGNAIVGATCCVRALMISGDFSEGRLPGPYSWWNQDTHAIRRQFGTREGLCPAYMPSGREKFNKRPSAQS